MTTDQMVDDIDNCDGDSVFHRTLVSHSICHSCEKVNFICFFTLLSFVITFWCAKLFSMFLTLFFVLNFSFSFCFANKSLTTTTKKNNYRNQESNETLITSSTSSLAQLEKKHQKESGISSISINQNAGSNTINSSKVLSEPSTVETYTNNNQNGYLTLTSSQGPNSFDPATIYSTARSANRHTASNGTLTTTVASTKYNNNNNLTASNSGTITSRYNNLYSGVATPSDLYDHQHYQQHRLNSQHQLSQQRHYNNDLDGFYISTSQTPRHRTETIASSSREAITRIIDIDAESIDLSLPQQYEVKIS